MSSTPLDPYAPPELHTPPPPPGASKPSTTGLTLVAVLTLLLAGLGLIGSLTGVMSLVFPQTVVAPVGGANPAIDAAQKNLQTNMQAAQRKWTGLLATSYLLTMLAAAGAIAGAVFALRTPRRKRTLFIASLVALCLVEAFNMLPSSLLQFDMQGVMQTFAEEITSGGSMPQDAGKFMGQAMKVAVYVSVAVAWLFFVGKVAFYLYSITYLRRPHVIALYADEWGPPSGAGAFAGAEGVIAAELSSTDSSS